MWRVEPQSKLAVSVKSNPGATASAQCGNRGYQNIKPGRSTPVPRLNSGQAHTLRAAIHADQLSAFVDNTLVWQGHLGVIAAAMKGPAGVRSDNARLGFELSVEGTASSTEPAPPCPAGPEESE
jgi:hypothetical protein